MPVILQGEVSSRSLTTEFAGEVYAENITWRVIAYRRFSKWGQWMSSHEKKEREKENTMEISISSDQEKEDKQEKQAEKVQLKGGKPGEGSIVEAKKECFKKAGMASKAK